MENNKSNLALGIDLGTTNTCVAIWNDGKIEVIPNRYGQYLTPSFVSYTDKEVVIGHLAKENIHRNIKGTLFGIKRITGRKFTEPAVQEAINNWKFKVYNRNGVPKCEVIYKRRKKCVYPEQVSALVLKEMKEIAEMYVGKGEITDAVITVPAYFNDHQRQATKDAAKIAGLNVLRLINEPTAAAVAYVYNKVEKMSKNILVYDLGGGTFDVSIITLNDCCVKVKATRGDTNLGGDNFDQRVVDYFVNILKKNRDIDLGLASQYGMLARLRNQVQRAKHELATSNSSTIEIPSIDGEEDMHEELTRLQFDDINFDLYTKTIEIVAECIEEAELGKENIDDIVLVGGSTRILKIQKLLTEFFGKNVSMAINQDQAVAYGAAILAANLKDILPETLVILDVISMSLGIQTITDEMDILIKRNSQLPTQAERKYTAGEDDTNEMRIQILMGDSLNAKDNLVLGHFDLVGLPVNPLVTITFKLDISGILTVEAVEASCGIQKSVNITLEKGRLTEDQIIKLKEDSDAITEENNQTREVTDIRNKFESYLLKLEDTTKSEFIITPDVKKMILDTTKKAFVFLNSKSSYDMQRLKNEYANVNRYCTTMLTLDGNS